MVNDQPESMLNRPQREDEWLSLLSRMAEATPDVLYIFDLLTKRNLYVNRQITAMLGYTPEDVQQMDKHGLKAMIHPDDFADSFTKSQADYAGFADGYVFEREYRVKHANGDWRWFLSREVVFARDADHLPIQLLGVARDITDYRRAEDIRREKELLQMKLEQEREFAHLKDQFMTTVSHEFRTPLASILASSELLGQYFDRLTPTRRDECLAAIREQVLRLREMLDGINILLRDSSSVFECRPQPVDLDALCQDVLDGCRSSHKQERHHLRLSGAVGQVILDPKIAQYILKQLLSNAIKYSPQGGVVSLEVAQEGESVVFMVRDEGIGIPPEDHDRIFETFYRGRNVGAIGGAGLGLKVVRDYVALHQGTISFESEPGRGTVFTVRLPLNLLSSD
jgi:PAS domain S-box-containing protein